MSIKVSKDINLLTGQGEEWLLDSSGNVLFVFIGGMIRDLAPYTGDREKTILGG